MSRTCRDQELIDAFVEEGSLGALVERFGYDSKREAREALDGALRALDVRIVKGLDDVQGLAHGEQDVQGEDA